jgi:hypothetical protein
VNLIRRLSLLSGLAILAVVCNHANWHVLGLFTPDDSFAYPYLLIDQIGKAAIPIFLFIAGFFTAYASGGGKRPMKWRIVGFRLLGLLWPWLIWSAVYMLVHRDRGWSLTEFFYELFVQYYFVPLLGFYYCLAPWLSRWASQQPLKLLLGSAIIQFLGILLFYFRVYSPAFPSELTRWVDFGPLAFLRFSFHFSFGLVVGMFPGQTQAALSRYKMWLGALALICLGLTFLEATIPFRLGGSVWPLGNDQVKFSSALWAVSLVLSFLAAERLALPLERIVLQLGGRTYGIYLIHYFFLGITARLVRGVWPMLESTTWLFVSILFMATVALCTIFMDAVALSPARRFYRYLFG